MNLFPKVADVVANWFVRPYSKVALSHIYAAFFGSGSEEVRE